VVSQPAGRVTLLFTDVEGSTRLLERLGTEPYAAVLEQHRRLLREAFAENEGYRVRERVARPDLLARVRGLLEDLEMAGYALGSPLAPVLISLGGPRAAFIGVALLLPLAAIATGRRLLDIDRHATVPVVQIARGLERSRPGRRRRGRPGRARRSALHHHRG
jgi:class 3 adenylate cyclase